MLKMTVTLATHLFGESVAKGLQFHAMRGAPHLHNVQQTVHFTLLMNNMFDELNDRFIAEGVRQGGNGLKVATEATEWFDTWERERVSGNIPKDFLLTSSTAEGLIMTLESVV